MEIKARSPDGKEETTIYVSAGTEVNMRTRGNPLGTATGMKSARTEGGQSCMRNKDGTFKETESGKIWIPVEEN